VVRVEELMSGVKGDTRFGPRPSIILLLTILIFCLKMKTEKLSMTRN
jgi:hypothetical protein